MIAYRIADARHPIFDSTGAFLHGGRWNSRGVPAIYAAATYSGALLEMLVHCNLFCPPKNQRVVRILVPDDLAVEPVSTQTVAGWDSDDLTVARAFGDLWFREKRTAVLRVPSVITAGRENNIIFNPAHPQFPLVQAGEPEPVEWDRGCSPRS